VKRRTFIKSTALTTLSFGLTSYNFTNKTHVISLSFDDGFRKSFYKIADIYEEYGLSACLNVIASGHMDHFEAVDDWILPELMRDFDDWNILKKRGHEIMPHSWQHLNLAKQPPREAKDLIVKCLNYFEEHLEGFISRKAVFNFPFNAMTPELEEFALSKVMAIRTMSDSAVNPIPGETEVLRPSCWTYGSGNIDEWVDRRIHDFLKEDGGWLVLNTHGLDGEGWGPISSPYLNDVIRRLKDKKNVDILPVGTVIENSQKG